MHRIYLAGTKIFISLPPFAFLLKKHPENGKEQMLYLPLGMIIDYLPIAQFS
jgi:hypothetical protein